MLARRYLIRKISLSDIQVWANITDDGSRITNISISDECSFFIQTISKRNTMLFDAILAEESITVPPSHQNSTALIDKAAAITWPVTDEKYSFIGSTGKSFNSGELRSAVFDCGVTIGSTTYVPLLGSASMVRTGDYMLADKAIYKNLLSRISLQLFRFAENEDKPCLDLQDEHKIIIAKLNAYLGLAASDGVSISELRDVYASANPNINDNPADRFVLDKDSIIVVRDSMLSAPDPSGYELETSWSDKNNTSEDSRASSVKMRPSKNEPRNLTDGSGLICPEYADILNELLADGVEHGAFVVRMPFVKGLLIKFDFHGYAAGKIAGEATIKDIYNIEHPLSKVKIIITQSMFKGKTYFDHLATTGSEKSSWNEYMSRFSKSGMSLLITGKDTPPAKKIRLNYQFLSTCGLSKAEIENLAKTDIQTQQILLSGRLTELETENDDSADKDTDENPSNYIEILRRLVKVIPKLADTSTLRNAAVSEAQARALDLAVGRLVCTGDVRFAIPDPIRFMDSLLAQEHQNNAPDFYAPGTSVSGKAALLRNPHISSFEDVVVLSPSDSDAGELYKNYCGHLTGCAIVPWHALMRLGGADCDGDRVFIVTEKLIVKAIENHNRLLIDDINKLWDNGDAQGWRDCLMPKEKGAKLEILPPVTIKGGQSKYRQVKYLNDNSKPDCLYESQKSVYLSGLINNVGKWSIAAASIALALPENAEEDKRLDTLVKCAILTANIGLEIDSAKSGVSPVLQKGLLPGVNEQPPALITFRTVSKYEKKITDTRGYINVYQKALNSAIKSDDVSPVNALASMFDIPAAVPEKRAPSFYKVLESFLSGLKNAKNTAFDKADRDIVIGFFNRKAKSSAAATSRENIRQQISNIFKFLLLRCSLDEASAVSKAIISAKIVCENGGIAGEIFLDKTFVKYAWLDNEKLKNSLEPLLFGQGSAPDTFVYSEDTLQLAKAAVRYRNAKSALVNMSKSNNLSEKDTLGWLTAEIREKCNNDDMRIAKLGLSLLKGKDKISKFNFVLLFGDVFASLAARQNTNADDRKEA